MTCATVSEAEVAAGFCDDVLIANEIVSADKCARVAALARQVRDHGGDRFAWPGSRRSVARRRAAGATIGVLVDLNVGPGPMWRGAG